MVQHGRMRASGPILRPRKTRACECVHADRHIDSQSVSIIRFSRLEIFTYNRYYIVLRKRNSFEIFTQFATMKMLNL